MTDLATVAAASRLLVATDFDGTLSHLVDDPEDAQAVPGAINALSGLAELEDTTVAVVSGRTITDLERLVGDVDDLVIVGEHGAAWRGRETPTPRNLAEVAAGLESLAASTEGAWVEHKQTGLALHTRLVTSGEARLRSRAESFLDRVARGRHSRGNRVIDVRLVDITKADAVAELRYGMDAVVFIGDDTTDETVFASSRPGDLMVKVGAGASLAEHRVADPEGVVVLLETLTSSRQTALRP